MMPPDSRGWSRSPARRSAAPRLPPRPEPAPVSVVAPRDYEAEVIAGLESFAADEIAALGASVADAGASRPGRIRFAWTGSERRLHRLRRVVAIHRVFTFDVPRPRALLGHQHLTRLVAELLAIIESGSRTAFETFRLSAAGADSPDLTTLRREIGERLDLTEAAQADLGLALRRSHGGAGWDVVARLTPRPLATRAWRVCDLPGALNATIASVMASLTSPGPDDCFVNLMCGSGTLLIERLQLGHAGVAIGVDLEPAALGCAAANIAAAGVTNRSQLVQGDVNDLPLASASADAIVVDLPFGQLMGSRTENESLYPTLVSEAARIARRGARLIAITASRRLFDGSLERHAGTLSLERTIALQLAAGRGYVTPVIYVLERK